MISLELIMAAAQIRAEIDLTMSRGVSLFALVLLWVRTRLAQGTRPSTHGCKAVTAQVALGGGMVWTPTRAWRPGTSARGQGGLRAGAPGRITGMVSWLSALLSGCARDCSLQVSIQPVRVPSAYSFYQTLASSNF